MPTIFVNAERRPEIERLIRSLPAILAGSAPDELGIARGFKARCAHTFFMIIRENFIIKSRGGTDEAGIKWPKLSPKYLAYVRPMGRGGEGSRYPPHAGGLAPGGRDGFMSESQLRRWRGTFARCLARLALQMDRGEAMGFAAAIAWNEAKRLGVKTKLQVFGDREVEILRDRGILFNSLSPGVVIEDGPRAEYTPPTGDGGDAQVATLDGSGLLCGTNVEYARRHHFGRRPFWPVNGELPDQWVAEIVEVGVDGLRMIGDLFA